MLVAVKSLERYTAFSQGRDVDSAVHREDESLGWIAGWVEEEAIRPSDVQISQAEYDLLLIEVKAFNATYWQGVASTPRPLTPDQTAWLAATTEQRLTMVGEKLGFVP